MVTVAGIRKTTLRLSTGIHANVASAGASDAQPLILLHGYTDSWQSFGLVIPLLAENNRVYAPDARGHGETSVPDGDFSIASMAADVAALLDTLGLDRAAVAGHSMGSLVARQFALDYPDRLTHLILTGSGFTCDNDAVNDLVQAMAGTTGAIERSFVEEFQASCVYDRNRLPDWFYGEAVQNSLRTSPQVWKAIPAEMKQGDQRGRLDQIAAPTLIIGGRHDRVFPLNEQEELARQIGSVALRIYDYCGHSPQWEEPGRWTEDVVNFLAQRTQAPAK